MDIKKQIRNLLLEADKSKYDKVFKDDFTFRIKTTPYDFFIDFILTDNMDNVLIKLAEMGEIESANYDTDQIQEVTFTNDSGVTIISKKDFKLSGIAHEILHAVIFILKRAGVKLSDDSEESYTYLFSYVLMKFLHKVKELK